MNLLKETKAFLVCRIHRYTGIFLFALVFGILCYANTLVHHLTNSVDGVWEGSYYQSGKWQISLGRFATLYVDKLHFGISVDPFTNIFALVIFIVGFLVILECLESHGGKGGYLSIAMFLSSVSVGVSLSYRFMSPVFALSFLFACLAVAVLLEDSKRWWLQVILSGICIAIQMGLYQAYLGVSGILFLFVWLKRLLSGNMADKESRTKGKGRKLVGKGMLAFTLGGIFYLLLFEAHLRIFNVSRSSYNGGDGYSVLSGIKKSFLSLRKSYVYFYRYATGREGRVDYLEDYLPLYLCLVVFFVFFLYLYCFIGSAPLIKKLKKGLWTTLGLLLVPPALFLVSFFATDTGVSVQMTGPYNVFLPLCVLLITSLYSDKRMKKVTAVICFAGTLFLYGEFYQMQVDQYGMLVGREATGNVAGKMLDAVIQENLYRQEYTYCILGTAAECVLFSPGELYGKSNYYAMYGCWWEDTGNKSWAGVYGEMGIRFPIAGADVNHFIEQTKQYESMCSFPQKGSIQLSEDLKNVVIIKLR